MAEDIRGGTNMDNVLQEIHNIAYYYHWGYDECWHIPSRERGVFNDKIVKQLREESRSIKNSSNSGNSGRKYRENLSRT